MKATLILTLAVVALAVVLLSVRIILKKGGRFSSQHIGDNPKMRENGIGCATSQDRQAQRKQPAIDVKNL